MSGNDINDTSILRFANGSEIDGGSTADLSLHVAGAGKKAAVAAARKQTAANKKKSASKKSSSKKKK